MFEDEDNPKVNFRIFRANVIKLLQMSYERTRWAGHLARIERTEMHTGFDRETIRKCPI
jgi:hypothetical protein